MREVTGDSIETQRLFGLGRAIERLIRNLFRIRLAQLGFGYIPKVLDPLARKGDRQRFIAFQEFHFVSSQSAGRMNRMARFMLILNPPPQCSGRSLIHIYAKVDVWVSYVSQ
jgi:hypothetical protein